MKVHENYKITEEKGDNGDIQYRVTAPVECPDTWIGEEECTIAIVYDKEVAYKLFSK